jgi:ABC-2 type transport system ATP-binding protein
VLTTHNLSDVERICPRIMIIDQGQIILDATQDEILAQFGRQRTLIVTYEHDVQNVHVPHGQIVKEEGNKLWIAFDRARISAFDLIRALGAEDGVKDISIQEASIESIVAQIYEDGIAEESR